METEIEKQVDCLPSLPRILATLEDTGFQLRPFTLKLSTAHGKTVSFVCLPPHLINDSAHYVNRLVPLAQQWFVSNLPAEAHFTVLGLVGKDNLSRLATGKAVLKLQDYKAFHDRLTKAQEEFDQEKERVAKEPQFNVKDRKCLRPREPLQGQSATGNPPLLRFA